MQVATVTLIMDWEGSQGWVRDRLLVQRRRLHTILHCSVTLIMDWEGSQGWVRDRLLVQRRTYDPTL